MVQRDAVNVDFAGSIPALGAMKFIHNAWLVMTGISTLGGLLAFKSFAPKIFISPSIILDPKNPFATPFILKNEGVFSIYKISTEVNILKVTDSRNNQLMNNLLVSSINNSNKLEPGKETALNISLTSFIQGLGLPFKEAYIEITIKYKPFLFFWIYKESFSFTVKYNTSGGSIWFPVNH